MEMLNTTGRPALSRGSRISVACPVGCKGQVLEPQGSLNSPGEVLKVLEALPSDRP